MPYLEREFDPAKASCGLQGIASSPSSTVLRSYPTCPLRCQGNRAGFCVSRSACPGTSTTLDRLTAGHGRGIVGADTTISSQWLSRRRSCDERHHCLHNRNPTSTVWERCLQFDLYHNQPAFPPNLLMCRLCALHVLTAFVAFLLHLVQVCKP